MLEILLYTIVFIVLTLLSVIYLKVIRPQKKIYDAFRAQGIVGEPFRPLIGQIPEMIKYRDKDALLPYFQDLFEKHGRVFFIRFWSSCTIDL